MRKLGQHFLKDKSVLEKIAAAIKTDGIKTVIEIGPGHGELTEKLSSGGGSASGGKDKNAKCKIIAIEKDEKLAAGLEEKFREDKNILVVKGDALKLLPSLVLNFDLSTLNYVVAGNIPYYITGYLLRIIGELRPRPTQVILLIQKEVAERVVAKAPQMNRLAASVQFWGEPKIIFSVPPGSFSPPPKVHSAVLEINPIKKLTVAEDKYYETVRLVFAQPRKTVLNNLSAKISKQEASEILNKLEIPLGDRPQNLALEKIISLAETLS